MSSRCQSNVLYHLTAVDSVFLAVPTVASDRRDEGQRLDPAVQSRISIFTLRNSASLTRIEETQVAKWLTK